MKMILVVIGLFSLFFWSVSHTYPDSWRGDLRRLDNAGAHDLLGYPNEWSDGFARWRNSFRVGDIAFWSMTLTIRFDEAESADLISNDVTIGFELFPSN